MEFSKQQEQVCDVLRKAVITLCKNMVPFQSDITVEGLIGITVDKQNVILVNILKQFPDPSLEACSETDNDTKDFDTLPFLGDAGVLMKGSSPIAEKKSVSSGLTVKEEPAVTQTSVGSEQIQEENYCQEEHASLFSTDDNTRVKGENLPMKCIGIRDELLPMDHDFSTLEEISSHLDYNSHLSESPTKNSSNDPFGKSEDFLSVKEESDSFTATFINDAETCLGESILPEVLETSFGDGTYLNGGDKLTCNHCSMMFSHKRSLRRHKKIHEGIDAIWRCDECMQVFNRKDILRRHLKKHHEVKQLKCSLCEKLFSRPDSLKRHKAMTHNVE